MKNIQALIKYQFKNIIDGIDIVKFRINRAQKIHNIKLMKTKSKLSPLSNCGIFNNNKFLTNKYHFSSFNHQRNNQCKTMQTNNLKLLNTILEIKERDLMKENSLLNFLSPNSFDYHHFFRKRHNTLLKKIAQENRNIIKRIMKTQF